MKFPTGWISEYVDLPADEKVAAEAFTLSGSEVEGIESVMGESVFDFGITVNRPDCMNVYGLAREAGVLFDKPLREPESECAESDPAVETLTSVKVEAPELCPRYAARVITGVKVGESPDWMRRRLELCGLRPVNAVVDVTNYLLLELGHPLHAFDMDKLKERRIVVRRARNGEKLVTLDGVERKLDQERLVIADAEKPAALAGVMGGEYSGVTEATTDVLLEGAVFDPINVRRTSKAVGLHTDASHRFERGVDFDAPGLSLDRAARLIAEICGGAVAFGTIDVVSERPPRSPVALRHERLEKVLGMPVAPERCVSILEALKFGVEGKGMGLWSVTVPSFRVDVSREIDLIEEVARIHGYVDLDTPLPGGIDPVGGRPREMTFEEELRDAMASSGCMEAIHMSMSDPGLEAVFDPSVKPVALVNPLSQATSVLRTTLLGRLSVAAAHNRSRGERNVNLFEVGKVFKSNDDGSVAEELRLGALCYSDDPPVVWGEPGPCTLLHLKGKMQSVFERLGVLVSFEAEDHPPFVPGLSLSIRAGDGNPGRLGTLGIAAMAAAGFKGGIAHGCEVILEGLSDAARPPRFTPVSRYPSIKRDMAFLIDKGVQWKEVLASIEGLNLPDLEALKLVELYEGPELPDGKRSFTLSVSFRSESRTLTEKGAASRLDDISRIMEENFSASRR